MTKNFILAFVFVVGYLTSDLLATDYFNRFNNHHGNRVIIEEKEVVFDDDFFLGLDGYYDAGAKLQREAYIKDREAQSARDKQIDKLINIVEQLILNRKEEMVDDKPKPKEQPVDNMPKNKPNDLDSAVYKIFVDNCAGCHKEGQNPKGGVSLVWEDNSSSGLVNLNLADRVAVYDTVRGYKLNERGKKLMPLGGPPLDDEDVEMLFFWMVQKSDNERNME